VCVCVCVCVPVVLWVAAAQTCSAPEMCVHVYTCFCCTVNSCDTSLCSTWGVYICVRVCVCTDLFMFTVIYEVCTPSWPTLFIHKVYFSPGSSDHTKDSTVEVCVLRLVPQHTVSARSKRTTHTHCAHTHIHCAHRPEVHRTNAQHTHCAHRPEEHRTNAQLAHCVHRPEVQLTVCYLLPLGVTPFAIKCL
jgi:hypothetical protein